jgi:hypothetical protein
MKNRVTKAIIAKKHTFWAYLIPWLGDNLNPSTHHATIHPNSKTLKSITSKNDDNQIRILKKGINRLVKGDKIARPKKPKKERRL